MCELKLTRKEKVRVLVALDLRAEAASDNNDQDEAAAWKALLLKVRALVAGGAV